MLLMFVLLIRLHYTELTKYSKTTKIWTLKKMMLQSSLAVNRRGIREKEQTRTKENCLDRLREAEDNFSCILHGSWRGRGVILSSLFLYLPSFLPPTIPKTQLQSQDTLPKTQN